MLPRSESGRLRRSLARCSVTDLVAELRAIGDAIGLELGAAPVLIADDDMHTFSYAKAWSGYKWSGAKALGRNASRRKAIDRIDRELARRGVDCNGLPLEAKNQRLLRLAMEASGLSVRQFAKIHLPSVHIRTVFRWLNAGLIPEPVAELCEDLVERNAAYLDAGL